VLFCGVQEQSAHGSAWEHVSTPCEMLLVVVDLLRPSSCQPTVMPWMLLLLLLPLLPYCRVYCCTLAMLLVLPPLTAAAAMTAAAAAVPTLLWLQVCLGLPQGAWQLHLGRPQCEPHREWQAGIRCDLHWESHQELHRRGCCPWQQEWRLCTQGLVHSTRSKRSENAAIPRSAAARPLQQLLLPLLCQAAASPLQTGRLLLQEQLAPPWMRNRL